MAANALTREQCVEYVKLAVDQKTADCVMACILNEMSVPALNRLCKTIRDRLGVYIPVDELVLGLRSCFDSEHAEMYATMAREANPGETRISELMRWAFIHYDNEKNKNRSSGQ